MSGSTNSIGLPINTSNPLSTLDGGIGRSVTPTSGSVLFYDATGVQQNNANFFWNNAANAFCLGTTTNFSTAPLTLLGNGGTTGATATLAYITSQNSPPAGNLYTINIGKNSTQAAVIGINKNTTTGTVPANAVFICTYSSTGTTSIGRGDNTGLPSTNDIGIDGSGNVSINSGNLNVANLTGSNLVVTDGAKNLASTNTLSNTVLGNIPKATVTSLTSGSGTYTTPANCTHIEVHIWGGGGGGGAVAGGSGATGAAGGGGGAGYQFILISSPAATYSYSVGALGAGGTAGANAGSNGGNTTFGTFTADGGLGGAGYTALITAGTAAGGLGGGTSGSATLSLMGASGIAGITVSSAASVSGNGGSAAMGGGGAPGRISTGAGSTGTTVGAGGGGALINGTGSQAGGNGGPGQIIVIQYFNG
jgi:hypothetical protein